MCEVKDLRWYAWGFVLVFPIYSPSEVHLLFWGFFRCYVGLMLVSLSGCHSECLRA